MITNDEYLSFIRKYKDDKTTDRELVYYFRKIKPYLKLTNYSDPSKILEPSDFDQFAFMGFKKSLEKIDLEKSESALSWTYHIVHQFLLREINKVYKKDKCFYNSSMMSYDVCGENDSENEDYNKADLSCGLKIEDFIDNLDNNYLSTEILKISRSLQEVNPLANKVFQLQLAFPEISRTSMAIIFQYKKRNGLSRIIQVIRIISSRILPKEIMENINYESEFSDLSKLDSFSDNN